LARSLALLGLLSSPHPPPDVPAKPLTASALRCRPAGPAGLGPAADQAAVAAGARLLQSALCGLRARRGACWSSSWRCREQLARPGCGGPGWRAAGGLAGPRSFVCSVPDGAAQAAGGAAGQCRWVAGRAQVRRALAAGCNLSQHSAGDCWRLSCGDAWGVRGPGRWALALPCCAA
jgi:hypothetical protein